MSAYESGVAMPVTNAAKELYRLAMSEGYASRGFLGHLRLPHGDPQVAGSGEGIISLSDRNISFYKHRHAAYTAVFLT